MALNTVGVLVTLYYSPLTLGLVALPVYLSSFVTPRQSHTTSTILLVSALAAIYDRRNESKYSLALTWFLRFALVSLLITGHTQTGEIRTKLSDIL
jgi:hypothetical protein